MKVVITSDGKGTRLSLFTNDIPKPILEYQINCLKENSIKNIYILIGHLGHAIKDYFKDSSSFGVNIKYIEKEYLGSAESLFCLRK